jgi:hypothetical protein
VVVVLMRPPWLSSRRHWPPGLVPVMTRTGRLSSRLLTWRAGGVRSNVRWRWEDSAPRLWPPPDSFGETRRLTRRVLPGVRYRRLLLWRYSLVWTKPA